MASRASAGSTRSVGEPLVDRLDALEPEQADHLARDHRAGAGDPGRDRGGGERAEHRAALERRRDPALASTASQPTKNTPTPAIPSVTTRSRATRGRGAAATGTIAGSLGMIRSVRSVAITCGGTTRSGAIGSATSTSITRTVGAASGSGSGRRDR